MLAPAPIKAIRRRRRRITVTRRMEGPGGVLQPISLVSEDTEMVVTQSTSIEQEPATVVGESVAEENDKGDNNSSITANGKHGTSTPTPSSIKKLKTESPRELSIDPEQTNNSSFVVPDGPPIHEIVGGSSVRQYLNKHLTATLLEGLRQIGAEKPDDPLRVLGEFLIAKADEVSHQQDANQHQHQDQD